MSSADPKDDPSVTDKPNRQSNSLTSMTSSVAVQSATTVTKPPSRPVRVSPQGSFAVPISVDSQDDNRRVTFANDAYRSESPCTACCRSCMRCCRWLSRCSCCCPRNNEVTKYVDENGEAVPEDDDDFGYGAEASFYDFDNDPRERDTSSSLRKCCRKELIGIKIRHWCYLLCLLAVAAFLSFYLWWYFSHQAAASLSKRISHMCADRVALTGIGAHGSMKLLTICAEMVSNEYPSILNLSTTEQHVLVHRLEHEQANWLESASWFGTAEEENAEESSFIAGVTVAAIVQGSAARAAYEAAHGPIWTFSLADANSGGTGLVVAPIADWYAPVVAAQGIALGASLDLAGVPYFNATLSRMIATARTQVSEPYYVGNYTAATDADGGVTRGTLPSAPMEGPLSDHSGHRMFSFTPIHRHNFSTEPGVDPFEPIDFTDPATGGVLLSGLQGLIVASWNVLPWMHLAHKVTSSSVDVLMTVWSSGVVAPRKMIYNAYQISSVEEYQPFYDERPFSAVLNPTSSSSPALILPPAPSVVLPPRPSYVDASSPSVSWQSLENSMSTMHDWGARNFYDGMGFVSRCTPTRAFIESNTDKSPLAIGALTSAAFFLIIFFIFVQLRYLTAKEREVRFKNRVLTELQTEREKADRARDQKTDFMAFLCHELRNPLHAVLSMSDSLQETTLDAEQQESVFTIHASSELMLAITNDILDLSKIEAGRIELESIPMDVSALVNSLVRGNSSWAAEKGVTVVGKIDPAIVGYNFIYADPTRLNQMLMNLLSNAIKFTGKNGTVTLEVMVDVAHSTPVRCTLLDKPPSLHSHHSVTLSGQQQQQQQSQQQPQQTQQGTATPQTNSTALVPFTPATTTPGGPEVPLPPIPAPPTDGPAPPSTGTSLIRRDGRSQRGSISLGVAEASELQQLHSAPPASPGHRTSSSTTQAFSEAMLAAMSSPTAVQTLSPIIRPADPSRHASHAMPPIPPPPGALGSRQSSANGMPDAAVAPLRHSVPRYPSSQNKHIFLLALAGSPSPPTGNESPLEHIAHARHVLTEGADSNSGVVSPRSDNRRRGGVDDTLGMLNTYGNKSMSSRAKSGALIPGQMNSGGGSNSPANGLQPPASPQSNDQPITPPTASIPAITSSLRIRRDRLTWNRLSPASSPLISHAPAALQATLPQLLLNRHRRTDSASASPRLFGPTHPSHAPGSSRDFVSNMSPRLNGEAAQHSPPPLPTRALPAGHAPLVRALTMSSRTPQGLNINTAAETALGAPSTHSPTHTDKSNPVALNAAHATNSRKSTLANPSDEAEEFSRTVGQVGSARLIFRVQDTGIGIPSEFMGALFEPYSQAKRSITRSHGGTGLGLAIVKRLSDLMAGDLMVESTIGQGTTFSFSADFLLARPPTPAMASMLRHIQPAGASTEIGQVRYSNYNCLKMAGDQTSCTAESSTEINNVQSRTASMTQQPQQPMEPHLPPEFTAFTMPPAALQLPMLPDSLYDNEVAALARAPPPLLALKRELSTIASAPSSATHARAFSFAAESVSPPPPEQAGGGAAEGGVDTHARSVSMGEVLPGTTPQVLSPTSSDSSHLLSPPSAASPAARAEEKGWVLIVDDAQINRKILLKMLQAEWQVDQAENGLEAVNLVDANPTKYSCCLMDLMMPVMGGTEALQQMRSRGHTDLPVIAVTANTMAEDITKCVSIGFTSFLSKPCRKELVRSMVKQYARLPAAQAAAASPGSSPRTPAVGGAPSSKRTVLSSPVLLTSSTNGQIVASLSPLPSSAVSPPSSTRFSPPMAERSLVDRRPSIGPPNMSPKSTAVSYNQPSQSPVMRARNSGVKLSSGTTIIEGEAER